jgi:hypothetical protein
VSGFRGVILIALAFWLLLVLLGALPGWVVDQS